MSEELLNPSVYKKAYGLVRSYILRKSGNIEDVQDVYHEGLLIFLGKAKNNQLNLTCAPESFILGICIKLWLKMDSKRKDQVLFDSMENIEDNQSANISSIRRKEFLIDIIQKNIKNLSQKCQEVFKHKQEGLTCDQIAERMKMDNEQILRNKMYTCKKRLLTLVYQDAEYKWFLSNE